MEMILPLMNFLKDMKNNGNRTDDQNDSTENNQNLNVNSNPSCLENRKNQRNTSYLDFSNSNPNLNGCGNLTDNSTHNASNGTNSQNININYNGNTSNSNSNASCNSNSNNANFNSSPNSLNSECMKILTHLFLQSQNQNLNLSNLNNNSSNNANNNNNTVNNNNNIFSSNNNFNNICNSSLNSLNNNNNNNNNNSAYNLNNFNNSNNHNNNNQNNSSGNNSNGFLSSNTNNSSINGLNLSSLFNLGGGNNGVPDFLKASNLISELISLEQQNRVQIDLIQKIIDNRYKNNTSINSALLTMLANNTGHDFGFNNANFDKNEGANTKSSSKLTENTDNKNSNKSSSFNISGNAESQMKIKVEDSVAANTNLLSKKTLRDPRQNNICGHLSKKHYAKGMCNNCYHSNGRNKKAWKCTHIEKAHYALGVCQTCYQSKYTSKAKKTVEDLKSHSSHHSDSEVEEKEIEQIKYCLTSLEEENANVNNDDNIYEKNEKEKC